jgi:16S rRNA processing protein RimM
VSAAWVTVAKLTRTRGNHGELVALPLSSHPERFSALHEVYLFGDGARYEIEDLWWHDGKLILKFRGVDSISEAEPLAGAEVRLPEEARVALDPGEFFQSDLVGCEVVDAATGERLGLVREFLETGGPGLLDLGGDFLIPFARSICVEIDPLSKRIRVRLPEGLRELNRP